MLFVQVYSLYIKLACDGSDQTWSVGVMAGFD